MQQIASEVWLVQGDAFIFRAREAGSRWTFRVPRSALEALDPAGGKTPQQLFDSHRPRIYAAAAELVKTGDARRQHTLTEKEINRLLA